MLGTLLVVFCCHTFHLAQSFPTFTVNTTYTAAPATAIGVDVDSEGNAFIVSYTYCSVYKIPGAGSLNGTPILIAGSGVLNTCGNVDDVGNLARFGHAQGFTIDPINNVTYVADYDYNRVRRLDLATRNVTTFAGGGGSTTGAALSVGLQPFGIVFHRAGELYVASSSNVLRIVIATAVVTLVSTLSGASLSFLCIRDDRQVVYVAHDNKVSKIPIIAGGTGTAVVIAGNANSGSTDGVGTSATFQRPMGVALNSAQTSLFIADGNARKIRLMNLKSGRVTTIAGTGSSGVADGAGLASTFSTPYGGVWFCNGTSCGMLIADHVSSAAVRFIFAPEMLDSSTDTFSTGVSKTKTVTTSMSTGNTSSVSLSAERSLETHSLSPSQYFSSSLTKSPSSYWSITQSPTSSVTVNTNSSPVSVTRSSTPEFTVTAPSSTGSLSRTPTAPDTATLTVPGTASRVPSHSTSSTISPLLRSSTASSSTSSSSSVTQSILSTPTRTKRASVTRSGTTSLNATSSLSASSSLNFTLTKSLNTTWSLSENTESPNMTITISRSTTSSLSATSSLHFTRTASWNTTWSLSTTKSPSTIGTNSDMLSATSTATATSSRTSTSTISLCQVVDGSHPDDLFSHLVYDNTTITAIYNQRASTERNVTTVLLSASKSAALKLGSLSLQLVLRERLYLKRPLAGRRVAVGTNGLTATASVTSPSVIQVQIVTSGSQYLGVAASMQLPLSNTLDGVCVASNGLEAMQVDFILTPTAMTALSVMQSVSSVVGPISAVSASPASAVAVTRLAILQALLSCDVNLSSNDGNSLLGIAIGPLAGAYMRGAVVGNIFIVVCFAAAMGLLLFIFLVYGLVAHSHPFTRTIGVLQTTFHVPGVLMLPIAAVCQPTLTAAVQLVVLQPVPGDRIFGILGILVVVGVLMMPFTIAISSRFCLVLTSATKDKSVITGGTAPHNNKPARHSIVCRRVYELLLGDRARWVPSSHIPYSTKWKKQYIPIFVDCGTWWYPLADMWISAAVGVVGGLTLSNTNVCRGQLSVVALSYLVSLLLQLFIVEPLVLASKMYAVVLQVLGVVSCVAVTIALIQNEEKETPSVTVATYTMLMIALLSTIKSLTDLVTLSIAFPVAMKKAYSRLSVMPQSTEPPVTLQMPQVNEKVSKESLDSASEASLSNDIGDQLNDDTFIVVLPVNAGEEGASILNEGDMAGDQHKRIDFIRDAAAAAVVCDRSHDNMVDFMELVFSDERVHNIDTTAATIAQHLEPGRALEPHHEEGMHCFVDQGAVLDEIVTSAADDPQCHSSFTSPSIIVDECDPLSDAVMDDLRSADHAPFAPLSHSTVLSSSLDLIREQSAVVFLRVDEMTGGDERKFDVLEELGMSSIIA